MGMPEPKMASWFSSLNSKYAGSFSSFSQASRPSFVTYTPHTSPSADHQVQVVS